MTRMGYRNGVLALVARSTPKHKGEPRMDSTCDGGAVRCALKSGCSVKRTGGDGRGIVAPLVWNAADVIEVERDGAVVVLS
jgi:hypothetical protein